MKEPEVIRDPRRLRRVLARRGKADPVGFVPTMGALHEGHRSLVRLARKECRIVVVSIFVNPLQFGPREDLRKYPRTLQADLELLKKEKVDLVFTPSARALYPRDFETRVSVQSLSRPLCGRSRPIHFAGVATVVLKLLNLVRPDRLYLGQKDYQQCRVIAQMVRDLALDVKVRIGATVREKDGLAMSSRNRFLSKKDREGARRLYAALTDVRTAVRKGERTVRTLERRMRRVVAGAPGARVDYAEIVDARTLRNMVRLKKGRTALAALAVIFGKTRLIDNLLIQG